VRRCLRRSEKPEFDAWRGTTYWIPEDAVIEFKRVVYQRVPVRAFPSTCSAQTSASPDRRGSPTVALSRSLIRAFSRFAGEERLAPLSTLRVGEGVGGEGRGRSSPAQPPYGGRQSTTSCPV